MEVITAKLITLFNYVMLNKRNIDFCLNLNVMRPRIKKQERSVLIYTTKKDKEMQDLAKFNRKKYLSKKETVYIGMIFGKTKRITKEEYEDMLALGLTCKMIKL